jgi:hypothetical protein
MYFNKDIIGYLTGTQFTAGLKIKIAEKEYKIPDRLSLIEDLAVKKRIIHMGCCDHIPLIEKKMKENKWLHSRLCAVTSRCLGVDINKEGIEYIQSNLGFQDVLYADLTKDKVHEVSSERWDYMVMGEILEHVDNPTALLQSLYNQYSGSIDRIIITVPNAFAWLNFRHVFSHKEFINSDHRYWFTPYTLAKIATLAHYKVDHFQFCEPFPLIPKWSNSFTRFLLKRFPAFRETLLMVIHV